jgi:hypothetical protein
MLVVKYLQLRSTFGWSLSNLMALLRQQLFVYRDLWAWIDDPFQPPPIPERLSLFSSQKPCHSRFPIKFQKEFRTLRWRELESCASPTKLPSFRPLHYLLSLSG